MSEHPSTPIRNPGDLGGGCFCPECGAENSVAALSCHRCHRVLDPLADAVRSAAPRRALHGTVVAVVAGICVVAVVLAWLTDLSLQLEASTHSELQRGLSYTIQSIDAQAGLREVYGLAGGFALAGLVAALVFAGRYLREVVLGACAGLMAQALLWLIMTRGQLGGELSIYSDSFDLYGPAPILLGQILLTMLFATISFAFIGWTVREQLTGKATCVVCRTPYSLRPLPPARCPDCDAEQARDGVQWPWVMLIAAANAIVFALIVALLREPLGFALECDARALSDACKQARGDDSFTILGTGLRADGFEFWAVAKWRYLGATAPAMWIAPLAATFLVKRGSRASAGALVLINWLLATCVIMVLLRGIGGSEGGFVFLLKMQVIALFVWGGVGAIGVLIGDKIRFRNAEAFAATLGD
jgi:hypothetical protein